MQSLIPLQWYTFNFFPKRENPWNHKGLNRTREKQTWKKEKAQEGKRNVDKKKRELR